MFSTLKRRKKKTSPSAGPKGDLDYRRWVVITMRNNGAQEAQFPLPVTINTERIAFDRDEPVIAPAYYLDTIDNISLPKKEMIDNTKSAQVSNQVRNEDDGVMTQLKYVYQVDEIPAEYQTISGIEEFFFLINGQDCPPEFEHLRGTRFGQQSLNQHNHAWSKLNEAKSKKAGRKTASANANAE